MKIALYGASGTIGSRIAAEATARGHQVTVLGRTATESVQAGDLGDADGVRAVAAKHDVIVSATGPSRTGAPAAEWLDAVRTLAAHAGAARVLLVGGAGSLQVDGVRLLDSPDFPAEYRAEAEAHAEALAFLRSTPEDVDWTSLSPAPLIVPGERTGRYVTGTESPVGDTISAEDFAVALVDELEEPAHRRARFTVAN